MQSRSKSDRKAEESDREARAKVSSPVKGYTVPYIILYIIYPFAGYAQTTDHQNQAIHTRIGLRQCPPGIMTMSPGIMTLPPVR